jgi:hypothetical protein
MAHPTVDDDAAATRQASVRELIAELAQVEDAVRSLPTYVDGDGGSAVLNPELLRVLDRERDIVARLRSIDLRDIDLGDPAPVIGGPASSERREAR